MKGKEYLSTYCNVKTIDAVPDNIIHKHFVP